MKRLPLRNFPPAVSFLLLKPLLWRMPCFGSTTVLSDGKIIAGQPSFLAPDYLPDFIAALADRGLERERDVTRLNFDGRLSGEAKVLYDWFSDHNCIE